MAEKEITVEQVQEFYDTVKEGINNWFKQHDKDGNDKVDGTEVDELIDYLYEDAKADNKDLSKQDFVKETKTLFDEDGNGQITRKEFVRAVLISFGVANDKFNFDLIQME